MENEFGLVSSAKIRVRYEETDQMGFVYHGKYFTWFEVGRTELFRDMDLPYTALEKRGIRLPVTEADCKYRRSARYDDILTVRTVITKLTPVRIHFGYQLLSEDGQVMAHGATFHAFVDSTGRPVNLSKKDPELWHQMMSTLEKGE